MNQVEWCLKYYSTNLYSKEYSPITGENKSGRFKNLKNNLDENVDKVFKRSIQRDVESGDLQGKGEKNIIASKIIDLCTKLEVLLGLKLSGHTDFLTEASNLMDETYKRVEIQCEQHYRNALNKFHTN